MKSSANSVSSDEKQISVTIAGINTIQSNDTSQTEQLITDHGSNSKDSNGFIPKKELTVIEERTSSRASGLSGSESKRG